MCVAFGASVFGVRMGAWTKPDQLHKVSVLTFVQFYTLAQMRVSECNHLANSGAGP